MMIVYLLITVIFRRLDLRDGEPDHQSSDGNYVSVSSYGEDQHQRIDLGLDLSHHANSGSVVAFRHRPRRTAGFLSRSLDLIQL